MEILRGYPHLHVLMRPGLGLYPALNLGIAEATGDVIGLLNARDRYLPGAVGQALTVLGAPDIDCASGGARVGRAGADRREGVVRQLRDAAPHILDWSPARL